MNILKNARATLQGRLLRVAQIDEEGEQIERLRRQRMTGLADREPDATPCSTVRVMLRRLGWPAQRS
jgi:hypothetical protein